MAKIDDFSASQINELLKKISNFDSVSNKIKLWSNNTFPEISITDSTTGLKAGFRVTNTQAKIISNYAVNENGIILSEKTGTEPNTTVAIPSWGNDGDKYSYTWFGTDGRPRLQKLWEIEGTSHIMVFPDESTGGALILKNKGLKTDGTDTGNIQIYKSAPSLIIQHKSFEKGITDNSTEYNNSIYFRDINGQNLTLFRSRYINKTLRTQIISYDARKVENNTPTRSIYIDCDSNGIFKAGTNAPFYSPSGSSIYGSDSPILYFKRAADDDVTNRLGAIFAYKKTVNSKNVMSKLYFRHYSYNSTNGDSIGTYEQYLLPSVTANLSDSINYNIITTKNLDDADSRFIKKTGDTMTGNLNINVNDSETHGFIITQSNSTIAHKVGLITSGSSSRGGLYSYTKGKWIIRTESDTNVHLPSATDADGIFTTKSTLNVSATFKVKNSNKYPGIQFYLNNNDSALIAETWHTSSDGTTTDGIGKITTGRWFFRSYSPNSTANTSTTGKSETYYLPLVTAGLTEDKTYSIITTKNLSDADSRFVKKAGDTLTGNLTIKNTSPFITFQQTDITRGAKPNDADQVQGIAFADNEEKYLTYLRSAYLKEDGSIETRLYSYRPTDSTAHKSIYIKCTSSGTFSAGTNTTWTASGNDYAEYREVKQELEPGKCIIETGNGDLILSTERLQAGAEIISDTYGMAVGQNDKYNIPIAMVGRVLAYPYEDKSTYHAGDPVCSGPNGTISKMTDEEIMRYPHKMIGTVSEIPTYETWEGSSGTIQVKGRIWIRIR